MGKDKLTVKGSLKYVILSLVMWFIVLFLVTAGINTLIKSVFHFFSWPSDMIYVLQMIVTFVVLAYYVFLVVRTIKDINYIAKNED